MTADAHALTGLQRASCLAAYGHIFPPDLHSFPIEATKEHRRQTLTVHEETTLVAKREGVLERGSSPTGPTISTPLFVAPGEWGKGIGGQLHDAADHDLASRGFERCYLWVVEKNHRARRFYEARGSVSDDRTDTSRFPPDPRLLACQLELPVDRGQATLMLTGWQGSE